MAITIGLMLSCSFGTQPIARSQAAPKRKSAVKKNIQTETVSANEQSWKVSKLIKQLKVSDPVVRARAAEELGNLQVAAAVEPPINVVMIAAISSLGKLKADETVELLSKFLKYPNKYAQKALKQIGTPAAFKAIGEQ